MPTRAASTRSHGKRRKPAAIPRAAKRAGAGGQPIPAFIRAVGFPFSPAERTWLRSRLARRLGKFGAGIQRVSVRLEDPNGPKGGVDRVCRVKVTLRGLPPVMIESRRRALQDAIDDALLRAERAVRKPLQRRRARPVRAAMRDHREGNSG